MSLSFIIPALNEASFLPATLAAIRQEHSGEVWVVDGGSEDGTREAGASRAVILSAPRGLSRQCNRGAERSTGDFLFFLAADTRLAPGWRCALKRALRSPYVCFGGMQLSFGRRRLSHPILAWGGNVRSRLAGIFLPDQGLFVRRESFVRVGGMPDDTCIPFAKLCRLLQSEGEGVFVRHPAQSSPRKYEAGGVVATVWKHARIYRQFRREAT